jgi:hypothetical protein
MVKKSLVDCAQKFVISYVEVENTINVFVFWSMDYGEHQLDDYHNPTGD